MKNPTQKWIAWHRRGIRIDDCPLTLSQKRQFIERFGVGKAAPRAYKSTDDWVPIAERMATDNGGTLQSVKWLRTHELVGLTANMRDNPERYAHLRQEIKRRTTAEQVKVAEALAKDNGGILPAGTWLKKNNTGLYCSLLQHPEKFAHIPRPRPKTKCHKWVSVAEELAKKNGGVVPTLRRNEYGALYEMMYRRPEEFKHLKRTKFFKTVAERVAVAEGLADKNGGVLPNVGWLTTNGYCGLYQCMTKNKQDFAHIKQDNRKDKQTRTTEAWVKVAEDLASKNGGILQNPWWLCKNGFRGLYMYMRKSSKSFAHITQAHGRGKWVPL